MTKFGRRFRVPAAAWFSFSWNWKHTFYYLAIISSVTRNGCVATVLHNMVFFQWLILTPDDFFYKLRSPFPGFFFHETKVIKVFLQLISCSPGPLPGLLQAEFLVSYFPSCLKK